MANKPISELILIIPKYHAATCNARPIAYGDESQLCIGYFENDHGEQLIFTRARKTGIATLRGGEIGWDNAIDVTNGPSTDWGMNQSELA